MDALNKSLADKSYVNGYVPSSADAAALADVPADLDETKFANVARWARHIRSFTEEERSAWGEGAAPAAAAAEDEDEDIDLFGSDDEEDEALEEERNRRLAESQAKKAAKGVIAKSSVVLDVKPFDDETDLGALEAKIREIKMEGLEWKAAKLEDIAFGIQKIVINCHVEDEKVSTDALIDEIMEFDDDVQSVDVAAFNKL